MRRKVYKSQQSITPAPSLCDDHLLGTYVRGDSIYEHRSRKLGDNGHGEIKWFDYSRKIARFDVTGRAVPER